MIYNHNMPRNSSTGNNTRMKSSSSYFSKPKVSPIPNHVPPPAPLASPSPVERMQEERSSYGSRSYVGGSSLPHASNPSFSSMFFGSMLQGYGFGLGSSMGRKVVDSMTAGADKPTVYPAPTSLEGKPTVSQVTPSLNFEDNRVDCEEFYKDYQECISSMHSDCDILFDKYMNCIAKRDFDTNHLQNE
jgi:hypothetical protein